VFTLAAPRRSLLYRRTSGGFAIRQPLVGKIALSHFNTTPIVKVPTFVATGGQPLEVAVELERPYTPVGSADAAGQQLPEVFEATRVSPSVHLFDSMVEAFLRTAIGGTRVREQRTCGGVQPLRRAYEPQLVVKSLRG
jgi:hypothetical protein